MQSYILKITPERTPEVWRTIEIRADQTLHDLHRLIAFEFDLDDDAHLYAFYLSGQAGDRETEYGGPRKESLRKARRARMGALGLVPGRSFLHLFDFGDMVRHRIDLIEIGEADEEAFYPRILEVHGEIEDCYDLWSDPHLPVRDRVGLKSLSEEIRLVLKLDSEEEEYRACDPVALRVQLDLARRVKEWGSREELGVEVLDELCEFELENWLRDLVSDLADVGKIDEAADLAAGMAEMLNQASFLSDRAFILAGAGRDHDARAQAEALLEKFPGDPQRIAEAGEVLETLGDVHRAESVYRRALRVASIEPERREATLRLIPLLRRQGRHTEARRLEDDERISRTLGGAAVIPVRSTPKVGRNDPCPCGSGRKHKKCCGASGSQTATP